jgi:hypothetical protein
LPSFKINLGQFLNKYSFGGKWFPTLKIHSSVYPSTRVFSTSLAAEEALRNILAQIAISVRSAHPRAARCAKELAGNLKTSFPFESKLLSMKRLIAKNNSLP